MQNTAPNSSNPSRSSRTTSTNGNGRAATAERRYVVLLVDDRRSAHRVLVPLLDAEGFDVVSAFDVSGGLDALNKQAIDAVIADLHLGFGPGGDTLLAAVEQWHPGIRAKFLLTADSQGAIIASLVGAVWLDRADDASGIMIDALRAALGR